MQMKVRIGRFLSKIKNGRTPWHVTFFALCVWSVMLGVWPVGIVSGICGVVYLLWPRIAGRRDRDADGPRE